VQSCEDKVVRFEHEVLLSRAIYDDTLLVCISAEVNMRVYCDAQSGLVAKVELVQTASQRHSSILVPKCAACQHGKQTRTPTPTKHGLQEQRGGLTADTNQAQSSRTTRLIGSWHGHQEQRDELTAERLQLGELVFSDHYESCGNPG
jgi:hypothetical protein